MIHEDTRLIGRSGLTSTEIAAITAGLLSIVFAALTIVSQRIEALQVVRLEERQTLDDLISTYYAQRPTGAGAYALAPALRIRRRIRLRNRRLLERSLIASSLEQEAIDLGCEYAFDWILTVGSTAREAALVEGVPLRRFLRTYHLGIIREGMIALPFVILMGSRGDLTDEQMDTAAWGLALVDHAAFYNSLARQQRQAVYFHSGGLAMGPVLRSPRAWRRPILGLLDRLMTDLRLPRWRKWSAERRVRLLVKRATLSGRVDRCEAGAPPS